MPVLIRYRYTPRHWVNLFIISDKHADNDKNDGADRTRYILISDRPKIGLFEINEDTNELDITELRED